MSSGNGTDLGHIAAMLEGLIVSQEALRVEIGALRVEIGALRTDHGHKLDDLRAEIAALRADHGHKIDELRQTLTEYHASVLGHGILISELEDRVRRIERHLGLSPSD
jgi:hypothetical protein